MTTDNQEPKEGELIKAPATLDHRRDRCSLDDAYVFNYTQNPKEGKTAALRAAGYDGQYIRQEAHRMHNRLRPKIRKVLQEITQDLATMSNQQLSGILNSEPEQVGYSTMLAAIKLGFDYGGHEAARPDDTPTKPKQSDIARRIEQLSKHIAEIEGDRLTESPA